jgi:hypothetical protein
MARGLRPVLSDLPYVGSELAGAPGLTTFLAGDVAGLTAALRAALEEGPAPGTSIWVRERYAKDVLVPRLVDQLVTLQAAPNRAAQ